jgi:hypothetical protein
MSPEQARGEHVDGRADLYAAGLVLFEMVAGRGPFDKLRESHELLLAHMGQVPPRLQSLVPGVPPELDEVVACLLAKDPRARPASARIAGDALRRIVLPAAGAASAPVGGSLFDQSTLLHFSDPVESGLAGEVTQLNATDAELTVALPDREATTLRRHSALGPDADATTLRRRVGAQLSPATSDTVLMASGPAGFGPPQSSVPVAPVAWNLATEPTVRLGDIELLPPGVAELEDTRTQLPAPDSGVSATPPPVVPAVAARPVPKRALLARWAGLGAVAAMSFAVAVTSVVLVRLRWSDSAGSGPAAAGSVVEPAAVDSSPEPLPLPSYALPSASAVAPPPSDEPRPTVAEPPRKLAPRARPVTRRAIDPDAPGAIVHASGRRLPNSGL